jgi:hypothetical protein
VNEALAISLTYYGFFLLLVAIGGGVICWMIDGVSSPPKMTPTQVKNRARWALFKVNVYLFKRKVFKALKFWNV